MRKNGMYYRRRIGDDTELGIKECVEVCQVDIRQTK
jgi:hypothetical protein